MGSLSNSDNIKDKKNLLEKNIEIQPIKEILNIKECYKYEIKHKLILSKCDKM